MRTLQSNPAHTVRRLVLQFDGPKDLNNLINLQLLLTVAATWRALQVLDVTVLEDAGKQAQLRGVRFIAKIVR